MSEPSPAPRRRLSPRVAVLAGVVICALLVAAYWTLLRTDWAVLTTGLRPAEAAAVIETLDAKGVPHRLRDDGTTILVPSNQVEDLRVAVSGSELPLKGAVGFELFNKSDMGLTDFAQKINYQRALQGELARTIMMIDGIDAARVHLALPERSLFRQNEARAKAAIEVIVQPGRPLSPERVEGIRQLVAAAVPELPASDVVVLDGEGHVATGAPADTGVRTPETDERVAAQNYYAARVRGALSQALPGRDIVARALAMPLSAPATDGKRDFALRLTIISATPLNVEEQRIARDAASTAAALDEAAGDAIVFETGPTSIAPPASPQPPAPRVSTVPAAMEQPPAIGQWILAAIAIMLVAAIAVLLLRRRRPRLDAEHDFAARLRAVRTADAR